MSNQVLIAIRIPKEIREEIKKAVSKGSYLNQSDLIREAIREKLEKLKAR